MAVAEARKMEKGEDGAPAWMSGPLGWGPRKVAELRAFLSEVRNELKKVTWPARQEVYSTTVIVIVTTVFFGTYLFVLDLLLSQVFTKVLE